MRLFAFFSLTVLAASAMAQLRVTSLIGDLGGAVIGDNQGSFTLSNGGGGTGSVTLRSDGTSSSFWLTGRGVAVFRARNLGSGNNASWMLPSDRIGGMSSAVEGDTRRFATWDLDPNAGSENPGHEFSMSVTADDNQAEGRVDFVSTEGKTFTTSNYVPGNMPSLDNSIYDVDPTVGSVVIDKTATPFLTLAFTTSAVSVTRDMLNDGEAEFASPFYDFYSTSVSAFFVDASFAQAAPINLLNGTSPLQQINPGDDNGVQLDFGSFSGTMTINISNVEIGNYSFFTGTTVENPQGLEDPSFFPSGWNGYYTDDLILEQVNVVPEPMTMTIMAIAGIISARRRRRNIA